MRCGVVGRGVFRWCKEMRYYYNWCYGGGDGMGENRVRRGWRGVLCRLAGTGEEGGPGAGGRDW